MLSVQVNLRTILKNVAHIKKHFKRGTKFCAVVKANAYGLGLVRISKLLAPVVDCLAVATVDEGVTLRQNGIHNDILVLGICDDVATAVQHDLIITLENLKQAQSITQQKLHPRLQIAVNTGMNRFGFSSVHNFRTALQLCQGERIEGLYTHLAYENDQPQRVQAATNFFQKYIQICQKYFPHVLIHAGCSGVIDCPSAHYDMLRIGKAMYGGTADTQTALTVTSQIVAVKRIKSGATVGYNGTYTAAAPRVIGIVRGGYANGIPTQFGGRISVLVGKYHCPIVGRVCMDYCFVDVTDVPNPLSKTVTFIAPKSGQTLYEVARQAQMITCDLLLKLSASVRKFS